MRILEIVNPSAKSAPAKKDWLGAIEKYCEQYLAAVKTANKWLLRGRRDDKDAYMAKTKLRNPKTSDSTLSDLFDQALHQLGFQALRSNSIFSISDFQHAKLYGTVYMIFPIDGASSFTYTNEKDLELKLVSQIPFEGESYQQQMTQELINWIRQWVKQYPHAQKKLNSMYPPFASLDANWSVEDILDKVEKFCYDMEIDMPPIPSYLTDWDEEDDLPDRDIDLDAFEKMYQPRQDHLEHALEQGVEVYVRGRYYALKLDVWGNAVAERFGVPVQGRTV